MSQPIFSICHASARPAMWLESHDAWWRTCKNQEQVEYIMAIDERWGFKRDESVLLHPQTRIHWCTGKRGAITAWNEAAELSAGKILIMNADDMRPPQDWDAKLLEVIPDLNSEFVVEVSTGPLADDRRLMVLYILSRKRYERLGYVLHPDYTALWVDNEYTEHARLDNVVIDARSLRFEHLHPHQGHGKWDAVYESGNTQDSWNQGVALFNRRKAAGFPRCTPE